MKKPSQPKIAEQRAYIVEVLKLLVEPEQVVEIRAPKVRMGRGKPGPVAGYFNDLVKLAEAVTSLDGEPEAIYFTLNPLNPDLIGRAYNRLVQYPEHTTQDSDILKRRLMLVDLDSKKPAGVSSTNAQHAEAIERAKEMRARLSHLGWPEPGLYDSGNGAHLLYRVDLPTQDGGLVQRVLEALDFLHSDTKIQVDTKVFNPSRITKLYGTVAAKGDPTDPDRPHRYARKLEAPAELGTVARELLEAVAALKPEPEKTERPQQAGRNGSGHGEALDLDRWIRDHNVPVNEQGGWSGGRRWLFSDRCPWTAEHKGRDAFIVQVQSGAIKAGCQHANCPGSVVNGANHWTDLREMYEPKASRRSVAQPRNGSAPKSVARVNTEEQPWPELVPVGSDRPAPFPLDALPPELYQFAVEEAASTQTPPAVAGMMILAVCAAAVAKKCRIEVSPGWQEPLNLFVAIVLPPAARKSQVMSDVVRPLEEYEQEQARLMKADIEASRVRLEVLQGRAATASRIAAKAKGEDSKALIDEAIGLAKEAVDFRVPSPPRMLVDDVTPEKLSSLLFEHDGRMAIFSPEGGLFDMMAGRYTGGAANFEVFLKGHCGDTLRVDRMKRDAEYVQDPALTICLAIQPDVLKGLADKPGFRGRGLIGRFLFALPENTLGKRRIGAAAVSDSTRIEYRAAIRRLLDLPLGEHRVSPREAPRAFVLRLTRAARDLLQDFERWLEPQLGDYGEMGGITDWAGKVAGAVARLIGVLHLADNSDMPTPWNKEIGTIGVERGLKLADFLIPHARAAYAQMTTDDEGEQLRYLVQWIVSEKRERFTSREAQRATRARIKDAETLADRIRALVQRGYVRQAQSFVQNTSGRPSRLFAVNPAAYDFVHSVHTPLGGGVQEEEGIRTPPYRDNGHNGQNSDRIRGSADREPGAEG